METATEHVETANDMLTGRLADDILDNLWGQLKAYAENANEHCSSSGCPGYIHFDGLKQDISHALSTGRPVEFEDAARFIPRHLARGGPLSAVAKTVLDVCRLIQSASREDWMRRCDHRNRQLHGEEWYARNHPTTES